MINQNIKTVTCDWEALQTWETRYGSYVYRDNYAEIYLYSGLGFPIIESREAFTVKDHNGVGNCTLAFYNVRSFIATLTPYYIDPNGDTVKLPDLRDERTIDVDGDLQENSYGMSGTIYFGPKNLERSSYFSAWIELDIVASNFEIIIMDDI